MKPRTGKRKLKPSGIDWIGDVPGGWDVMRLKYACSTITDGSHFSPECVDEGFPYVTATDVRGVGIDFSKTKFISEEAYDELVSAGCGLKQNDVLMVKDGATTGRVGMMTEDVAAVALSSVAILRTPDDVDRKFLYWGLQGDGFQRNVQQTMAGSAMPRITVWKLGQYNIAIPPLDEQSRIAAKLDRLCGRIDELSANLTKEIAALQDYRKSLITECVTKGLNPKVKMKPSGVEWIGDVPEGWTVMRLKYGVTKIGSGKTPLGGATVYSDDGILFIRSQNVYDNGLITDDIEYISEEIDKGLANSRVCQGDVLLNITGGSIGRCCVYPLGKRANVNQHVCIIRVVAGEFLNSFVKYFINGFNEIIVNDNQQGGNRESLNFEQIGDLRICVPPFDEQCRIAALLDEKCAVIDAKIAKRQRQLEKLAEYRASAIYEYVTGKKEVAG